MRHATTAVIVGVLLLAGVVTAQQKRTQDVDLQAAIRTETIDGNLKGAIEQYKKIATASDRAVAAQALVRMAECYQKLGDSDARTTYERVIREFSDQADSVSIARARLAGDRPAGGTGLVARQMWTERGGGTTATVALDGRSVSTIDSGAGDDIVVRDLQTGRITRLGLVRPDSVGYAEWPVLSPDLKRVAYAWSGPDTEWNYQVRLATNESGAKAQPVGDGKGFPYCYVRGWSADGRSLLLTILDAANTSQIAWMSTVDGRVSTLKSLDWRSPGSLSLSPDGRYIAYDALVERGRPDREIRVLASDGSSEAVVVSGTGSNRSPVWTRDGARVVFKSDRAGTVGLWSIPVRSGKADGSVTKLKGDVGDIDLVGFSVSGSLIYAQRVGARDVFAVDLDPATKSVRGTPSRLVDTFVGVNLNPASSPNGKSLAYVSLRGTSDQAGVLVIRSLESGTEKTIPIEARYGTQARWFADGQRLLVLARNRQNHATLYSADVKSGEVEALIDTGSFAPPVLALSPDGRSAYAAPDGRLTLFDLGTGRRTPVTQLGDVKGISASPDGRSIAFCAHENSTASIRARLYVADADGSNVRALLTTDKREESCWAVAWATDGSVIYFIRGLPAKGASLWRVAATGGPPIPAGGSFTGGGGIEISHDGRQLIYASGGTSVELWSLDNLDPVLRGPR